MIWKGEVLFERASEKINGLITKKKNLALGWRFLLRVDCKFRLKNCFQTHFVTQTELEKFRKN